MEDVIVQKLRKGQDPIRIKITQEQLEDLKKGKQVRGTMLDIDPDSHMNDKIFIMPHIETWELIDENV
jgi:hypothetical protein